MSRRAWLVLTGLVVLSLLVAGVTLFAGRRLGRLPLSVERPGFGAPWEPRAPWEGPRGDFPWRGGRSLPWRGNRPDGEPFRFFARLSPWWTLGRVLASEVFFFVIGALVLALFPQRMRTMLAALDRKGKAGGLLGLGFLSGVLLLALIVLAFFSLVGLPFLLLLLTLFVLAWGVGLVAVALRLGVAVRRQTRIPDRHILLDLALGVLGFFTLGSIPFLGWLTLVVAGVWGLGTVIATRFGSAEGWSLTEPPEASPPPPAAEV